MSHDLLMYGLVLHQFCQLLITLLEADTLVDGAKSLPARAYALTILDLLRPEWMREETSLSSIFPRNISPLFVPRIICIAGLALNANDFTAGTVISKVVADQQLQAGFLTHLSMQNNGVLLVAWRNFGNPLLQERSPGCCMWMLWLTSFQVIQQSFGNLLPTVSNIPRT
jgi:hypothetical protein